MDKLQALLTTQSTLAIMKEEIATKIRQHENGEKLLATKELEELYRTEQMLINSIYHVAKKVGEKFNS